jgi:prephenate dehydrogenase
VKHARVVAFDVADAHVKFARAHKIKLLDLEKVAASDVVILAVPVSAIPAPAQAIAPHIRGGALVMDVASVKIRPAKAMQKFLPKHADIICTHPLFGPQSAKDGLKGHKIVVSNIRGARGVRKAVFVV